MCFSATASFGAGAILTAIGAVSLKTANTPKQLPFASIPLIFAAQQIAEGFLWLSLTNPEYARFTIPCTYLFLFFAQIFWPTWVPFAALKLEANERKSKLLKIMTACGAAVSLYFTACIIIFPVEGMVQDCHILYVFGYPQIMTPFVTGFYAIATIGALMVSSVKGMKTFGISVLVAYVVTAIFYLDFFVSVWCFFSAILSILIVSVVYNLRKSSTAIQADTGK